MLEGSLLGGRKEKGGKESATYIKALRYVLYPNRTGEARDSETGGQGRKG